MVIPINPEGVISDGGDVGLRRRRGGMTDRLSQLMRTLTLAAGVAAAATLVFSPSAAADVPGIAQFVGSWHAHEEGLDIQPNGHGRETYPDRLTCPDAPMSGCGMPGTTDFMLTSVSGDTATRTITAASNPKQSIGGPVTIELVGGGQGLELTIAGGDQGFPFCNSNDNDAARDYYCGA
ncbi:MAG: hypothetical protein QOC62_1270 [Mycobacterium sp.]|jgi:hypothetical protein|nr:hypothetical protein [Mycobacterium sp.]